MTTLSTATEFLRGSTENFLTQLVARAGGPAAADFTLRALADLAKRDEAFARGLYNLILAVETPAEFAVGGVETILPILERNGGALGALARTARGFLVNFLERGLTRFYEALKAKAQAGDFEAFRATLGTVMDEETDRLTPKDGVVTVLVLNPTVHMAYRGKDDPAYVAARAGMGGRKIVTISPPKSSGEIRVTEIDFGAGEIGEYEISFDEALKSPFISFSPSSFPDLVTGFMGGTLGRKARGSAWSQVSSATRRKAGKMMTRVRVEALRDKNLVITNDQIQQIKTHCSEPKIIEMIAESESVDEALVWILIAGDHASADMVFAQHASNALQAILEDVRSLRRLAAAGIEGAGTLIERARLADRVVFHGKWSFRAFLLAIPLYLAASLVHEEHVSFVWRIVCLLASAGLAAYFVGWLIAVGSLALAGGAVYEKVENVLTGILDRFGFKREEAETDPVAVLTPGGTVISDRRNPPSDYRTGIAVAYLGDLLGTFVAMAFLLNLGIFIEEGAKHLHDLSMILRLVLLAFLAAVAGSEFYGHRVERKFREVNDAIKRETLGSVLFWRILKAKPAIGLVVLVPILVVTIAIFDVKNTGPVEENVVVFTDKGNVRLARGLNVDMKLVFQGDVGQVWECSINRFAHARRGVENLPDYVDPKATVNDSRWWEFRVNPISRVLYTSRRWMATIIVGPFDAATDSHTFKLPSGEKGLVESSFPDAVDVKPGKAVRIPAEIVEHYRENRPGTTGGTRYLYEADGLVRATDADLSKESKGATAAASVVGWAHSKSLGRYLGFGTLFIVLGFIVLPQKSEEPSVGRLVKPVSARTYMGLALIVLAVVLYLIGFVS